MCFGVKGVSIQRRHCWRWRWCGCLCGPAWVKMLGDGVRRAGQACAPLVHPLGQHQKGQNQRELADTPRTAGGGHPPAACRRPTCRCCCPPPPPATWPCCCLGGMQTRRGRWACAAPAVLAAVLLAAPAAVLARSLCARNGPGTKGLPALLPWERAGLFVPSCSYNMPSRASVSSCPF